MRWFLAGIIHLVLIATAFAGVSGKVESIGFASYMRADCWTPLLIQIQSDESTAQTFSLQVVQLDLDGDEVVYTRPLTVNPGTQSVWTYFKPQSSRNGLPVAGLGTSSDLSKVLRVYVATEDGSKRLAQIDTGKVLPQALGSGSWESITVGQRTIRTAQKLVLIVGDRPNFREYSSSTLQIEGANETLVEVGQTVSKLPDNPIGYDAVDAVIWTTADATRLDAQQFRALRQYVRGGGKLVCVQSGEVGVLGKFEEMLPVTLGGTDDWSPASLASTKFASILLQGKRVFDEAGNTIDPFAGIGLPLRIGRATPKDDAVVGAWEYEGESRRPLIVRHMYGLGSVSWVALNVADASLTRITTGWPNFWQSVFDWKQTLQLRAQMSERQRKDTFEDYDTRGVRDLGFTYTNGLNLASRTSALVSIAFVVFIGYWIVAGPATYFVLAARKQTHLSWFVYGAVAIAAVVLTLGVVRLMLGGSAEIRHVSMVRVWCGGGDQPARVATRVGVYLPQDRSATPIAIERGAPSTIATLTPLAIDPRFVKRQSEPRDSRYSVPIPSEDVEETLLEVPFRSTLKKLEADWAGAAGRISGSPILGAEASSLVGGLLSNDTGQLLNNVLIAFRYPLANGDTLDYVMYAKTWESGKILDLQQLWKNADPKLEIQNGRPALPLNRDFSRGRLSHALEWLASDLRSGMVVPERAYDDSESGYRRSFPLVSLFDASPAMVNSPQSSDRVDLHRSGVRQWDISHALACGEMVVLGTTSGSPLPMPLTVDGASPAGFGTTLWQFVVPLDRKQVVRPSTTEPAP
jgi:hypothetical protein